MTTSDKPESFASERVDVGNGMVKRRMRDVLRDILMDCQMTFMDLILDGLLFKYLTCATDDTLVAYFKRTMSDRKAINWNYNHRLDPLKVDWTHSYNNSFALEVFNQINQTEILPQQSASPQLCETCSNSYVLSQNFKLSTSISRLCKTSESCKLCEIFLRCFRASGARDQEMVEVFRVHSTLKMSHNGRRMLRIFAGPGPEAAPPDIQVGFPILPEVRSRTRFELFRAWLRACDKKHTCLGRTGYLPTRVLYVGDHKNPDSLRLCCTEPGDTGRYVALSHRWGELEEHEKLCTYQCNIDALCTSIDFERLPKTFQDAITVTRELGVQFLWIDSICIIQSHRNCSECHTSKDWDIELGKMEEYYSSAYCTIAATSAKNSKEGFLERQSDREWVKVPNTSESPLYVCEDIDDFHRDVENSGLSQRGWVLQERALSRRTIHFTSTQAYWECGNGVRCETLTDMRNSRALFLSDPQFPESVVKHFEGNKIRLFETLFEGYSKRVLSYSTDRPVAISGLEKRLASTFDTKATYGIFERYLHRSLLWSRSDKRIKRIQYPDNRKVPSWSWMAYEGEISYMNIPFEQVEWSNAIQFPSREPDNDALSIELKAPARKFSLGKTDKERRLHFDEQDRTDIERLMCIVIGREKKVPVWRSDEQEHYVLVVAPTFSEESCRTYERAGVGRLRSRNILFKERGFEVRVT